jgi:diguanylate cyclase (GGDEF)-like protein/PAS domain S-box-containing protein
MTKIRILIIEDNPISRKVLKLTLESDGFIVVDVTDGASALHEATNQQFDMIIQDLFLPDIDGFALNKKLRLLPGVDTIPIFALSGFLNTSVNKEEHYGFTTFLLKPIEPSYLLSVVKAHLPISTTNEITIGNKKHILIVDDNPIQLKLFCMQLTNVGFEVTTALDGVIAHKAAIANRPDAIISDILMPNMDGFDLCVEIKRDPTLKDIPVVLLTSHYLEEDDLALAKKVGASVYLTRTPDVESFISELVKVLNSNKPSLTDVPLVLTNDIKEKHNIRAIHQLEQQVLDNSKLSQRCAMLMSQLALSSGIANALTTSSINIDDSLKEVLYFCLDATGISKGILYIKKPDQSMMLSQQIGYQDDQIENLKSFFGLSAMIPKIIENNEPFAIPSNTFHGQNANQFLDGANVKSAIIVPLFSGAECLGILLLGSDLNNLSNENTQEFVQTLGTQFGLSIALASSFYKVGSSEKRYRQFVEITPDAVFIQQDGKFVYANNAALKLLGTDNADVLLTHSFYDFFPPDYQQVLDEYLQRNDRQMSTSLADGKLISLNGNTFDIEVLVSPFEYHERPAVYMIMRDITERKRSALHLEIQYAIAWVLAESATLYVATAKILSIICERLQWDCGIIWAVDKNDNVLRCTRTWQMPNIQSTIFQQESQNHIFAPGEELPGRAWKERKAIWSSDIFHENGFLRSSSAANIGLNTAVAFPIIYENEVLGVIEFFSTNILQMNYDLLLWFESIGNQFGMFLIRKHMEKQMLYLAEHDVLTGLSNRSLLEQYLNTAIHTAKDNNQKLAILFLDLDHFKYINDSMGHQAGDLLLKEMSERFSMCLRPVDTISRLGGDEFIIIIPNLQKSEIIEIIDRLQNQLSKKIIIKDKEFFMTVSIGVSIYPDDGDAVQTLIKRADIAMYAAKEKGRNNYMFCTPEMIIHAENMGNLQNDLRHALEHNEFVLYYQPKIDVLTQKVVGTEALIRWKRGDTILLPGVFIAAVEDSDLIIPMTEWVIKAAAAQTKIWQIEGLPTITMSINISVKNLNKQLLQVLERMLAETKINPNFFEIELTESALMQNVDSNIEILHSIKEMGFKMSIDDFGTGYSSLSYLNRFPIDIIKIDQSFVRNIVTSTGDAAIVTAIIAMSHSLGFRVIAEGVENIDQLQFLCNHGCDEIQGYYFSRPIPAVEAATFIKNGVITWKFD